MRGLLFSPERQISLVLAKGNFTKKKKKTKRSYDEQVKLQCRVSNTWERWNIAPSCPWNKTLARPFTIIWIAFLYEIMEFLAFCPPKVLIAERLLHTEAWNFCIGKLFVFFVNFFNLVPWRFLCCWRITHATCRFVPISPGNIESSSTLDSTFRCLQATSS